MTAGIPDWMVPPRPSGYEAEREMAVRLDRRSRPESADRDRSLKPFKYAQAGIPHFWLTALVP